MKQLITLLLPLCFLLSSCDKEESRLVIPGAGTSNPKVRVVNDHINGQAVVVAGTKQYDFMVAYGREMPDGVLLEFSEIPTVLPLVMEDQEGNRWDLFGTAVSGPRKGQRLPAVSHYTGFWFAIAAMYPVVEIFEGEGMAPSFLPPSPSPGWTVPEEEVMAGSGFDLIPALDFPKVEIYREKDFWDKDYFLEDTSRLIGLRVEGQYRLYPLTILEFHEIVNDVIGGAQVAVSFCPLTGTATAWHRGVGEQAPTFGVSGLLYNSNLIAFDRHTESLWSQMRQECIGGPALGAQKDIIPVVETTWASWKTLLREPQVVSFDTGFGYDYSSSPYCNYAFSAEASPYPIQYEDVRLPAKERVLGVVANGEAKAYRFASFDY